MCIRDSRVIESGEILLSAEQTCGELQLAAWENEHYLPSGTRTPLPVSYTHLATLTVRFQPTTTKNLDRTTATRSMVTGAKCARDDKLVSAPGDGGSVDDPNDKPGGGSDGGDDGEAPDPTV